MNYRCLLLYIVLLISSFHMVAQPSTRNQNSSRSNHTRQSLADAWSFGFSSGAAVGLNSGEAQLFRGNGFTSALQGQYFLGPVGFGLHAGFVNSPLSDAAINQFIIDRKFPQGSTVTSTAAQNAFLLAGPTLRLGNRVQVLAGLQGGLFFNQGGSLEIGQPGAVRPFYRFDAGTRSLQPGWNGTVAVSYPLGTTTALQLNAGFLRSSTLVQVFDPQRGIDLPVEQSRKMQVLTTGISFIKQFNVKEPRETGSGLPTGRRQKTPVRNTDPDADDDGVSLIHPESSRKPVAIKTKATGAEPVRTTAPSCGPVTTKTTNPDGTVEETTFSCPDDAVQYKQKLESTPVRISTNFTTRESHNNPAIGSHIIAGKIVRSTNQNAIVTNHSQIASSGIKTNPGVQTNLYVRETGSGMATGKRSREAGSGLPTGRRQYQPLFFDGHPQNDACNPCLARVNGNPVYEEKGGGENPLYESKQKKTDDDCDGLAGGFDVQLIDKATGAVVATTKTNSCGEYWFANVPDGSYHVAVTAMFLSKKGYDYYKSASDARIDVAGAVQVPNETWQHMIYGRGGGKVSMQDISIVMADADGDGMADVFHATGTYSDGTVRDASQSSASKSGGGGGKVSMQDIHFAVPVSNQRSGGGKVSLSDLHLTKRSGTNGYRAVATFSDGKTQDVSDYVEIQQANGVIQFFVQVADTDEDGAPDLIWSPRSNFGATSLSGKVNVQDLSFTKKTDRYVHVMPVHVGDVDGDGAEDLVVGNGKVADLGMSRKSGNLPDQPNFPAAKPGNPIRGVIVKGGRNPGGDIIVNGRTTALGEFEFPNLEAGNYRFTVEAWYLVNDGVDMELGEEGTAIHTKGGITKLTASQNSQSLRTGTTGNTQPTTRAQDHNSSRSNKTASTIAPNPVGTDSTNSRAQDHNSSRSNKTASSVAPAPGGTDTAAIGKSIRELFQTLDAIEQQLDAADMVTKATINTSRSNTKGIQNAGNDGTDSTGMITKATINTSRSNTKGKRTAGNDGVDSTGFVTKANINTSRSNSKGIRNTGNEILTDINNGNYNAAKAKLPELNRRVLLLQQNLKSLGADFTSLSTILKTKHDTVKNSIQNVR